MTDYSALVTKWGTLSGTTASKLSQINALTVTGSVPTTLYVTADQLANCVNYTEFKVLTATQQSNLLSMLHITGQLLGGSANTTHLIDGMILDYFPGAGPTIAALTALAQGAVQPWWQVSIANGGGGLSSPVTPADLSAAGGLT